MSPISEDELENIWLKKKKIPKNLWNRLPDFSSFHRQRWAGEQLGVKGRCKLCALNFL